MQKARDAYSKADWNTAEMDYREANAPCATKTQSTEARNGLCMSDYQIALYYNGSVCRGCAGIALWREADEACRATPDGQALLASINAHQQQLEKQLEAQENLPPPPPQTPEQRRAQQQAKVLLCAAMMEYLASKRK